MGPDDAEASHRRPWPVPVTIVVGVVMLIVAIGAIKSSGGNQDLSAADSTESAPDPRFVPMLPVGPPLEAPTTTTTIAETEDLAPTTTVPVAPPVDQVFAPTSPFNAPIDEDPVLDPASDRIAAVLRQDVVANLYEFGIAIYEVDESTRPVDVACTQRWGTCLLEDGLHRVPDQAVPAPGDDGTLVVIDWSERRTVEMWQAVQRSSDAWTSAWGTTTPIDGSGIPELFGNGSGVSHLAGVVRVAEIANGRIDHALAFSTNQACRDEFRFPANKTDGQSTRADCVPEGVRIQLDPSLDLETMRLTSAERTIAQALQTYGAYAVDAGGAPMALYFEIARDASSLDPGAEYRASGLDADYFSLQAIPWEQLRVLSSWDGT